MKKKYTIIIFIMTFTFFLLLQLIIDYSKTLRDEEKTSYTYSSVFDDLALLNKNTNINLNMKSSIVVVNFWASWCIPCIAEMSSLISLRNKFSPRDLEIVSINGDDVEKFTQVKNITKFKKVNFPIIYDSNGQFFDKFQINVLPLSLVFFKGKLYEIIHGVRNFVSTKEIEKFNDLLNSN